MTKPLLQVKDLHVHFPKRKGWFQKYGETVKAVNGLDLTVDKGKTLGVVGESGCGKSTLARTIAGLESSTSGEIFFDGKDITTFNRKQMHEMRRDIQMVFQDPFTSLNPRMKIGEIIAAPLKAYKATNNIKMRVKELLEMVGLKPDEDYHRLPHEFSGGQRQRIGIARAIALEPRLIICDEPVSALDVSVQAQVINLFEKLQDELDLTYVFITHDLSLIRHIADEVLVMYLGKVMETSDMKGFYNHASHPYTNALLSAIPTPDPELEKKRERIVLRGELPSPANPPSGCVFHTRCPFAQEYCKSHNPTLDSHYSAKQKVACFYPLNDGVREKEQMI